MTDRAKLTPDDPLTDPNVESASGVQQMLERLRKHGRRFESEIFRSQASNPIALRATSSRSLAADTPANGATDSAQDSQDHQPQSISRFQIVRRLGEGGHGLVFLAYDPRLKRPVALKIPRPEALVTPELRSRFLREAEAAAALNHPHLTPVYESGSDGAVCYIACAYVEGMSLAEWLDCAEQITPARDAAQLVATLADAIQHAHSRGVLHRDLKPANILLSSAAGASFQPNFALSDCVPQITDFGLARVDDIETTLTLSGSILGTPAYMAPEQAAGEAAAIDTSSDVYGLGAILYELLTGRPPFQEKTLNATLQAVLTSEPTPPERIRSDMPLDLSAICMKCLEKEQSRRYRTAAALSEDLGRYLNREPVWARRIGVTGRCARFCRRNPFIASLTTATIFLILLLAVGSTVAALMLAESNRNALDSLEKEIVAKDQATKSEELAIRALFEARVQQARAFRSSGRPGQRFDSLQAIEAALKHRQRLELTRDDLAELRDEVIAAAPLVDLRLDKRWPGIPPLWAEYVGFSPAMDRYARWEEDGRIVVRSMEDNRQVLSLRALGNATRRPLVQFSRNGRLLAVGGAREDGEDRLQLWSLQQPDRPLIDEPAARQGEVYVADFSDDGRWLAFAAPDDAIALYDLESKNLRPALNVGFTAVALKFQPNGNQLAAVRDTDTTKVVLIDPTTGATTPRELRFPSGIKDISWSHDGRLMAAGCIDDNVYVWDTTADQQIAVCRDHHYNIRNVAFARHSELLVSSTQASTTCLWEARTGRQLLATNQIASDFSADDRWLGLAQPGVAVGRWEIAVSREFFTLPATSGRSAAYALAFSPDGRLLASADYSYGVRVWDTLFRHQIARLDASATSVRFSPDGASLYVGGYENGIHQWPIHLESDDEPVIRIDAPQRYVAHSYIHSNMSLSENCGLAVLNLNFREAGVFDLQQQKKQCTLRAKDMRFHAVSPDEKWIATGSWRGSDPRVWNAETGVIERELPVNGSARVTFSPNGRWLVTCSPDQYQVWSVGDWRLARQFPAHGFVYCRAAFTQDSRLMAMTLPHGVLLVDPATGREYATLTPPEPITMQALAVSPAGDQLAVSAHDGLTYVWRLDLIRNRLRKMELDWESPPPESPSHDDAKPLAVAMPSWSASSCWNRGAEYSAMCAFDGSQATRWNSARGDHQAWVAVRWPAPITIKGLIIRQAFDRITGFRVQQLAENSDQWQDVYVAEGDKFTQIAGEKRSGKPNDTTINPVFAVDFPEPVTTHGIRLLVTDTVELKNSSISIFEIECVE